MLDNLIPVMRALENGDKAQARRLLRPLLENPTAELWYLAAQASEKTAHEIACLERALALDPLHGRVNNRLQALRKAQQTATPTEAMTVPAPESRPRRFTSKALPAVEGEPARSASSVHPRPSIKTSKPLTHADLPPLKKARNPRRKGSGLWPIGCLGGILLSLFSSYFVLMVLGSGIPGQMRSLVGADEAPEFSNREDAVYVVAPSKSQTVLHEEVVTDILEPGYAHEVTFAVRRGEQFAIAIQFFSPYAQRVSRNVAIVDALGQDVGRSCRSDQILEGDTGMAFVCQAGATGYWNLRVYGREGESTGAYFVTVGDFSDR